MKKLIPSLSREGLLCKCWYAFGRLLSFAPAPDNESKQALEQARQFFATRDDGQALSQDWHRVGADIRKAMDKHHHG